MPAKDMYISAKKSLTCMYAPKGFMCIRSRARKYNPQRSRYISRKSIVFTPKSPIFSGVCALSGTAPCEKCPVYSKKEPYISTKENQVSAKEPYILHVRHESSIFIFLDTSALWHCACCVVLTEPYISAKEPYLSAKEPYQSNKKKSPVYP